MPRHQKPVPGEGEEQQLVPVGGGKEKKNRPRRNIGSSIIVTGGIKNGQKFFCWPYLCFKEGKYLKLLYKGLMATKIVVLTNLVSTSPAFLHTAEIAVMQLSKRN